jgi:hypothetical protein
MLTYCTTCEVNLADTDENNGLCEMCVEASKETIPLTEAQDEWIQKFTAATSDAGDGVSDDNLRRLQLGVIGWEEFVSAEIDSYIEWKREELEAL